MTIFALTLPHGKIVAEDPPTSVPKVIEITESIPYGTEPVNYFGESKDDIVAKLQQRIDNGTAKIQPRGRSGYLLDVLRELDIDPNSQTLVFSKTSVNQAHIKPRSPRAIFFNDDVSIAWVPGASSIEITVQDARRGSLFFSLTQPTEEGSVSEADVVKNARFHRDTRCTACHVSRRTLMVPGHLVGSVLTDESGRPREGFSAISHETPIEHRWGGWYVTGAAPKLVHLGNLISVAEAEQHEQDPSYRGTLELLEQLVDLSAYPVSHSDIVAMLVLNHQMRFFNLTNRVRMEHAFNRRSEAEEQLVRYALMENEAPLNGPVRGSTKFAEVYQQRSPRDSRGRSLRDLDLQTKLFKHSLSPLIGSQSFQSLPAQVKARLYKRLDEELVKRKDEIAREVARFTVPDWP